jgi:hypothetical protein
LPRIAHGVNINAGATGYVFNGVNGGALTVTAGGINANESVTINAPVTIAAPQSWNVAKRSCRAPFGGCGKISWQLRRSMVRPDHGNALGN